MLGNLASVPDEFWQAKPSGGERTIASIVPHVGGCIVMYDESRWVLEGCSGMFLPSFRGAETTRRWSRR